MTPGFLIRMTLDLKLKKSKFLSQFCYLPAAYSWPSHFSSLALTEFPHLKIKQLGESSGFQTVLDITSEME